MNANQKKYSYSILICSDRASTGERPDQTAPILTERLAKTNYNLIECKVVPDKSAQIKKALIGWINQGINLILTSGGTGVAPTDITPEATLEIIEKRVPGIEETMRAGSLAKTPHAMLSRAVVGIAKSSLIINLPGSPKGALENLQFVEPALEHALKLIAGEKADK